MKFVNLLAAAGLAVALLCTGGSGVKPFSPDPAFAQAKSEKPTRKQVRKARRDQRASRRAASRSKRAACRAEARARGLGMIQRERYVRRCVRR
jgi:hypothetical protein